MREHWPRQLRSRAVAGAFRALLALLLAFTLSCASPGTGPPGVRLSTMGGHTPVVFVPGVTGTKLVDPRDGELVWGSSKQLVFPRDGGYRLALPLAQLAPPGPVTAAPGSDNPAHPQSRYETPEPLWQMRLPGWTKPIYLPLLERFEQAGYRLGELTSPEPADDLFFFNYDWRYGNLDAVHRLDDQLEALSEARGGTEVDLICQSNAAKICRWLAKYGTLDPDGADAGVAWQRGYHIRKLILIGASNNGALRVLQLLLQGRNYVPLVGRRMFPETFFSIRPLFEDLPADRDDLFFDEGGSNLAVDLFDARNWLEYGWSIFSRDASERLRREPRTDLFGDREAQLDYLRRQLRSARRIQLLLARDSEHFQENLRYYRLENESSPTIDRALLTRKRGDWRTYFLGDRRIDRDPVLRKLAAAPGDGHAVLSSQRGLSPQEVAAISDSRMVTGGHFEAIVEPEGLDAIMAFLAARDDS
ncbi:MAG: hypothetical protein IH936_05885 [Acidobacteria bacterium]|nr:hypothetical protein [Acidobacteriota bacterium]